MWRTVFLLVFFPILSCGNNNGDLSGVVKVLKGLQQLGDYDVILVISQRDPELARRIPEVISMSSDHRMSVFSPEDLTRNQTNFYPFKKSCDLDQHMTYLTKKPELIFTVTFDKDEVQLILESLSDTVTECVNLIKPGYYRSENLMAHYLLGNNRSESSRLIFEDDYVKIHKSVLVFENMLGEGDFEVSRYDIYSNRASHIIESLDDFNPRDWLTNLPMNNITFNVSTLPYDIFVIADIVNNEEEPRRSIRVKGGFEVDMLEIIGKHLDFSLDYWNPADFTWGHVEEEPIGYFKDLVEKTADIAFTAAAVDRKVVNFAGFVTIGRYTIACPNPRLRRTVYRLLDPFDYTVWILIILALVVISVLLFGVSRMEEKVVSRPLFWSKLSNSGWYTFTTILGETIAHSKQFKDVFAIRLLCAIWMVSAFVLTSSYSGALRAVLVTPTLSPPIDTIRQLIKSDLQWSIVSYDDPIEQQIAASRDPDIMEFWAKKGVVEYESFYYEKMKEVYEGKLALMDWGDSLSTAIDTAFTLPNGKALIHIARDVNFATSSYTSYLFHPMNPWIDRFRRDVSALYEGGVQLKLITKNKRIIREQYLGELLSKNITSWPAKELVESGGRGGGKDEYQVGGMNLKDLRGVFYIYTVCMLSLLVLFLLEVNFVKCGNTAGRKEKSRVARSLLDSTIESKLDTY